MFHKPIPPPNAPSDTAHTLPCQTGRIMSVPRRVLGSSGFAVSAPPAFPKVLRVRLPDLSQSSARMSRGRRRPPDPTVHDRLDIQRGVIARLRRQAPLGLSPLCSTTQIRSAASPPSSLGGSFDPDTGGIQSTYVRTGGGSYIPSIAVASLHLRPSLPIGLEATVSLARSEYVAVVGDTVQTNAVVSLLALSDATLLKIPSIALRVVLVLDVSSSMRGKRYKALVEAVEAIVDALGKADKLAIVAFNDEAQLIGHYQRHSRPVPHPGKPPDIPGKAVPGSQTPMGRKLLEDLAGREPSGTTDMLSGLVLAARTMDRMACSDTKNHIILITDGWPDPSNSPEDILSVVEQCIDHRVSVSSVGCGRCFNEDLLMEIASVGCGSYYYTDDENLKLSLRNELRSLNTIVARDVKVELAGHKVAIDDVFGYHYKRCPESPAERVTIFLGDVLASDAKRDILLGISWIQTEERRKEILDVRISYTCVASGYKEISTTLKTDIRPPDGDQFMGLGSGEAGEIGRGSSGPDSQQHSNQQQQQQQRWRGPTAHSELLLDNGKKTSIVRPSPSIGMVVDKVQKVAVGKAIMDCIERMSVSGDQFALKMLRRQITDFGLDNDFMTGTTTELLNIISLFESRVRELASVKDERAKGILRMKLAKDMKEVARRLLRN